MKVICGFLYGLLLALLFYEMILIDLEFTPLATVIVGAIISSMIAFGVAFSMQIRCIALLSFPMFGGQTGRSVLRVSSYLYTLFNFLKKSVQVLLALAIRPTLALASF